MAGFSITAELVDVHNKRTFPAEIQVRNNIVVSIREVKPADISIQGFILPGFIDAHVHIESSMLVPSEFARLAVVHGTVATVSDPHEIANVCGVKGVEFMINNGKQVPFKFHFGAPSCVPATSFETSGAIIDSDEVGKLLANTDIYYLSEMMNFPGVLNEDPDVLKKIAAAHTALKPVDGHAPGLRGEDAKKYIAAGITTDHECFTREEALDKLQNGMKILIREGSAAKNFEALVDLLNEYPNQMMFCSDDKHPDSLVAGHINTLCARAVSKGIDVFKVLQAACVNPVDHYKLKVGLLKPGDPADFILVEDLISFKVIRTYINSELVAQNGRSNIANIEIQPINNFSCLPKTSHEFKVLHKGTNEFPIIEALDGQLITNKINGNPKRIDDELVSDVANDILKIVVVNRYGSPQIAKAFIKNFGLKKGAIASSVAHDSHNIVAVGVDDYNLCEAVNKIIENKGGISFCNGATQSVLSLPVAGLMSTDDGYAVAEQYAAIDKLVKKAGASLSAPFMTLSFMALLVIPHLKLSDLGLFDVDSFRLLS